MLFRRRPKGELRLWLISGRDNDPRVAESDDELLRRCQEGDETALGAVIRSFRDRVFRLACRVLGDAALAEEATAHTFVKVWERCGQWRGESAAATWIYRISYRTILDVQRTHARWWRRWAVPASLQPTDARLGPIDAAVNHGELERRARLVRDALQHLSDGDRALVHWYYFENLSLPQIEDILNVPRANLKMRLARARERLRPLLRGVIDDGESV